ncbi:alpha/beta-hydrolase [Epithele typhae]|uniref:alpha/beta-hydrolase n=1 Tax=Epithele typhae TaxID=378194 RepID=UPI002008C868|nr:alpha/beta-hydrolase [Epithele typhae]KAH9924630.1 alpha/beta-hydrolase [Epithele typhae]
MSTSSTAAHSGGIMDKLHKFAFASSALYAVIIMLLAMPFVQRHALFQNAIRIPWGARFDMPEKYGLAPGKTMDFKLITPDNLTIGAWFVLSDPYYQEHRASVFEQPTLEDVHKALKSYPTVLYCHGAAATRAAPTRIQAYSAITSRLKANVFTVDYRGFGDSEGIPSAEGVIEDAKTAWRWLMEQGVKADEVVIVGHSLGTAIATGLATALAEENIKPRGVALLAPFTSLLALIETTTIQGIPILQPLQSFAFGKRLLQWLLVPSFDTLAIIGEINVPILIAHSQADMDIPHYHSRTLLDTLLDPHLPAAQALPDSPSIVPSDGEYRTYLEVQKERRTLRSQLVRKIEVPTFGTIEEFDGSAGKVVYVETFWGNHNEVGLQEGVQDLIASTFRLGTHL